MTIFDQLKNALAPFVGGSDASGMILGMIVVGCFLAGFVLLFGKDFLKGTTGIILMIVVISFVSAPGVGWFPIWIPFLLIISLGLIYWQKYL